MRGILVSSSAIIVERHGATAWIMINRPEVGNLINPSVIDGLDDALGAAEDDDDISVVVIGGVGDDFCKGADVGALGRIDAYSTRMKFGLRMQRTGSVFGRIDDFPKPVIGAINGSAIAGGLEIVLCCDLVVATRTAAFGEGHATYGQLPGGGGSIRLARLVGPTRAKYMLFTSRSMPAQTFLEWGVVHQIVDAADLVTSVDRLAESVALARP
ncbi:MAG TPA: enoyl-CoA hydratase/isomerase family protein [Ilumatobacteraceae bacterium]